MKQDLVAKICFSPELQDIWPKTILTAEAHLTDSNEDAAPWSMRAELWNPPNEEGIAWAWISFLSQSSLCGTFSSQAVQAHAWKHSCCQLSTLWWVTDKSRADLFRFGGIRVLHKGRLVWERGIYNIPRSASA